VKAVVSLIEVVTQFVIQKFHVHRKRAALVVACVCFVVSIPITSFSTRTSILKRLANEAGVCMNSFSRSAIVPPM
jgi:SNF family Na+-dependent transporter